jgi:hypothetical protein
MKEKHSKAEMSQAEKELKGFLGDSYAVLSTQDQVNLLAQYTDKRKTPLIYFWWFISLHYLYLRKWGLFALFFLTLNGLGVWWVIDLFRLPTILDRYNQSLAEELYAELYGHHNLEK